MRKVMYALAAIAAIIIGGYSHQVESQVRYFGIARYETTGWTILNNQNHKPYGLIDPYCMPSTGELRITYIQPLVNVGVANVTVDDTYAGKVVVGASVGLSYIYIRFSSMTGTTIHCSSGTLIQPNSNLFVDLSGEV